MAEKSIANPRVLAVPMNTLYDTDVLLWSEQQTVLLRRLAAGERVNDQVDWGNVIDEVESVGAEQLHAVESLLMHAGPGAYGESRSVA